MTPSEEKLLTEQLGSAKTQRKAFETLVHEYSEPLYWQVRRVVLNHDDANDVLQNAFLKAWTHLDEFQKNARLSTWLYRIAINESIDFVRRQKNQKMLSTDDQLGIANQLLADKYFDGDETQALLQEAITQLPDVQRLVFNMRYFDNKKYSEISEILHTTEGALKASYHIAVKKISEFFRKRD